MGSEIAFGPGSKSRYTIIGVAANFAGFWFQKAVPTLYLPEAQSGN